MTLKLVVAKNSNELGAAAPQWWQLLPCGEILIEGEPSAVMDDAGAAMILEQWKSKTNDMVIDYEHQTLKGVQAPAAGWVKEIEWRGKDGLWLKSEWTEKAADYIKAREYRYFSPVAVVRQSDRKIIALYNVALTNQPRIMNLEPLVAKHQPVLDGGGWFSSAKTNERSQINMIEKMRKLLGLADNADESQVMAAAEAIVAKNTQLAAGAGQSVVACKSVLGELKLPETASEADVLTAIGGLKAPATAAAVLSQEVATLKSEIASMKQEDLVAIALKDGKTSPDELAKWGKDLALKSPEQFKLIVLSRPAGSVIPIDSIGNPPKGRETVSDDAVLLVAKALGVTREDIQKYGSL